MHSQNNSFNNISESFIDKWQQITDLLAKLIGIPAALIMKKENEFMEVFITSNSEGNPYHVGDKEHWHGLYCETVIKTQRKLLVPNALKNTNWDKNPDIKLGMIAYCGFPINFPNGTPFGTICVLDNKENPFSREHEQILWQFKNVIELDLGLIQSINLKESHNSIQQLLSQNIELEKAKRIAKEKEKQLTESERFHKEILSNISDAVFLTDLDYNFTYICPNVQFIFGYQIDEVIEMKKISRLIPEITGLDQSKLQRQKEITNYECWVKDKSGDFHTILITAKHVTIRKKEILFACRDITKRKDFEQALKESEIKLKTIINTIPDFLLHFDKNGKCLSHYQSETNICKPSDDLIKKSIFDIFDQALADNFLLKISEAIHKGYSELYYEIDGNGSNYYHAKLSKLNGNEVIIIIRNITELKEIENNLIKLNASKDVFLSVLAHDLKNPFFSLLGYSELLLDNIHKFDLETIEKQVAIINEVANQTYYLLEELLMWSKSQSGTLVINKQDINLREICNKILVLLKNQVEAKNISMDCLVNKNIILSADINMLQIVLSNLISNAIKYTYPNGHIKILAEKRQKSVTITISDNGIGISKKDIQKLWEVSEHFTRKGTSNEEGTGFGLIFCKEFIEKHDGEIWVTSEPGKGSDFKFTMPLSTRQ